MIVVCTSCSAKFRVPDEKIGPRGAKLRCSKCQHVFVVKREPAGAAPPPAVPPPLPARPPAVELALEEGSAGGRRAGPGKGAFSGTFGATAGSAVPAPQPPAAAQTLPQPEPPPFPPQADPFAGTGPALGQGSSGHLPVTDLSDLAPPPAAELPPLPPVMAEPPPLAPAGAEPPHPAPTAPSSDTGIEFDRNFNAVSLEERTPTGGAALGKAASVPMPGLEDFAGDDPFAGHGEGIEPGPATGADLAGGLAEPPPPAPGAAAPAAARAPALVTRPIAREVALAELGPPGPVPARRGRMHAFIVNVISLAVLLAVTLALIALWQGEGLQPRFLRRLPFLARSGGDRGEVPLVAHEVTNGLYETARGGRILFVRGRVEAHSAISGPVQVRAEILRGDQVLARVAGPAGAVPTPEELQAVDGPEGARRLEALLAPRAVRGLKTGESAPFLLLFTEVPPRLGELTFRVVAEPAPRG